MRYLSAIVALGLLIAFHELGHLLFARLFRIRVDRFAIGFGPPLLAFTRGGIEWVLGAIPLGGYVRIHGMNPHEEGVDPKDPSAFVGASAWKRALVLAGGSCFNYLLALVVLVGLLVGGTHVPVPMTIGTVAPGSEAARAQILPGDLIVTIDGVPAESWSALVEKVTGSPGQALRFEVLRDGRPVELTVRPRPDEKGYGRIGISQQYVFRTHTLEQALPFGFAQVNRMAADGVRLMWRLVSGQGGVELSSPVAIVKQASDAASSGLDAFLRVLISISVALAVFNLLPVPALDGGRLLFVGIEAITRRPVNPKLETLAHTAGFVALLGLILVVAFGDVRSLLRGARTPAPVAADAAAGVEGDAGVSPDAG